MNYLKCDLTEEQLEKIIKVYDGRKGKELDFYKENDIKLSKAQILFFLIGRQYGKSFYSYAKIMYDNKDKKVFEINIDSPEMFIDPDYEHNTTNNGFRSYINSFVKFLDKYFTNYIYDVNPNGIRIKKVNKETKIEVQKEWYTFNQCKENPNKLYVFGDNTFRVGSAGQASIRKESNSFGIATKVSPSTTTDAYFKDDSEIHWAYIKSDIEKLKEISKDYDVIVFPADGLGTGLSDMPNKCPRLFQKMVDLLIRDFDYDMSKFITKKIY